MRTVPFSSPLPVAVWLALAVVLPAAIWLCAAFVGINTALTLALLGPIALAFWVWIREFQIQTQGPARTQARTQDRLTGALGRGAFEQAMNTSFSAAPGLPAACLVVDLDEFHGFNDRWGRAAGDEVLRICASRLGSVLRDDDLVCRLDADAFGVFLAPSSRLTLDAVMAVSERVQAALSDPVRVEGVTTYISACIGIALRKHVSDHSKQPGVDLLAAAERAMVDARNTGPSSYRVFSAQMHAVAQATQSMADDVARALEDGEIEAWFQPQVSVDGTTVTGMEALARWHHPQQGPISPAQFLPAIEAIGRGEHLSNLILKCALKALHDWDAAGVHVPQVGVNFAAHELRSPRLVEKVKWELDRFAVSPNRLAIEILETVISHGDDDMLLRNLACLRDLGCRIELDDFGTGAAAIATIRRFAVTRIKIDRSFVTRLDRDPDQASMCEAMMLMARQLKIDVLAEGVETVSEQKRLQDMGCGHVQGFGIARPMPGPDALAWLIDHQHKHPSAPDSVTEHAAHSKRDASPDLRRAQPTRAKPSNQPIEGADQSKATPGVAPQAQSADHDPEGQLPPLVPRRIN